MTLNTQPLAAAGAPHLRARGLRLARGGRVLHDGIDLTLAPGDRLAVVGENGRGKTTLLEALAGVLEADGGTIERHGSLGVVRQELVITTQPGAAGGDRKSTRLNSSHVASSYAVFCLNNKIS